MFKNTIKVSIAFSRRAINKIEYELLLKHEPKKPKLVSDYFPSIVNHQSTTKNSITHVSAFCYGNAGDALLPVALRDVWHHGHEELSWQSQHVYEVVNESMVSRINGTRGVIIGGGGLFLKDTNANNISGWQWPCSVEMLEKIQVPVVLYAVGYNRFRGQDEFDPCFNESIVAFARKAEYIGLRNTGSINAIKNYLPHDLHHKLRFQPCMTTFLSQLYPSLCDYQAKEDFVAVNAAFDRSHLRFGENIGAILTDTARAVKAVAKHYPIKFYSHMQSDEAFLPFLQSMGVKFDVVRLNDVHPAEIVKAYAKPRLVIGMRGHAQMIPFGCNTPIASVVSHNKMQWFVDDMGKPEWGADLLSPNFGKDMETRAMNSLANFDTEMRYIAAKQRELFELSCSNVRDGLRAMGVE